MKGWMDRLMFLLCSAIHSSKNVRRHCPIVWPGLRRCHNPLDETIINSAAAWTIHSFSKVTTPSKLSPSVLSKCARECVCVCVCVRACARACVSVSEEGTLLFPKPFHFFLIIKDTFIALILV
jgi:hypothetical protein